MTNQEKRILEIIQVNPTIEQAEIAEILGIKRSTVAVHISSLIKQGYLVGKGYIINKDNYVVGIGAANVDVYGKSRIPIRTHYDHPANILTNVGGVTHNILTNLSKLGCETKLITAIGDDGFGKMILEDSKLNNIDTKNCLTVKGKSSGVFMQIQDENNDMYLAVCDMSVIESLDADYIKNKAKVLLNSKLVLIDPSLTDETIKKIIDICKGRVALYCDPISDNYALKMKQYVKDLDCIKPNKTELENLSGIKIKDENDLYEACQILLKQGLHKIFVSLGKDGILYMDDEGKQIKRKLKPVENMVNASGAGDALMAAIIYGEVNNLDIDKTIDYGLAAGIGAITSESTINSDMSIDLLERIVKENRI